MTDHQDTTATDALRGRVAIVTGASRGIGASIAKRFAAEGAAVALVARTQYEDESRVPGTLTEVLADIHATGGTAFPIVADLGSAEQVAGIVARAEAELGPVDILVNNAGFNRFSPIEDVKDSRYRAMFEVMVHAPFRLSQAVVPGMKARARGWVVNVSSKQARHPVGPPYPDWARDGSLVYGMCKAALDRLTTGLAAELHGTGVAVNSLGTSGLVVTPGATMHGDAIRTEGIYVEPDGAMAEAALRLCTADPHECTGRIVYSLEYLGKPERNLPWSVSATF